MFRLLTSADAAARLSCSGPNESLGETLRIWVVRGFWLRPGLS